jgi:hypothetical protein
MISGGIFQPGGSSRSGNPIIVMIPEGSGISGNVSQSGVKKSPPDALEGSNEGFLGALIPSSYRI